MCPVSPERSLCKKKRKEIENVIDCMDIMTGDVSYKKMINFQTVQRKKIKCDKIDNFSEKEKKNELKQTHKISF